MKKNIIMTFFCACIPGFGQMYQGYMKRGVSLAAFFWGCIAFTSVFWNFGEIALFALPIIWGYSFFDTFNIRGLTPEQRYYFTDEFLPSGLTKNKLFTGKNGTRVVGVALIVVGLIGIYNQWFNYFYWMLEERMPLLASIVQKIPGLVVAVVLIAVGIKMVSKAKKQPQNDEIVPYKGENKNE